MGARADALLEDLPSPPTIEDLVAVQQAILEEDGDVTHEAQYHLALIMPDPVEAGDQLEAARAAYFDGSPPGRSEPSSPLV